MVRRIVTAVLAFFLAFGVLGLLSPMHAGMFQNGATITDMQSEADEAASMGCLLHCLSSADNDLVQTVIPVLFLIVAIVFASFIVPLLPEKVTAWSALWTPPLRGKYLLTTCKRE